MTALWVRWEATILFLRGNNRFLMGGKEFSYINCKSFIAMEIEALEYIICHQNLNLKRRRSFLSSITQFDSASDCKLILEKSVHWFLPLNTRCNPELIAFGIWGPFDLCFQVMRLCGIDSQPIATQSQAEAAAASSSYHGLFIPLACQLGCK